MHRLAILVLLAAFNFGCLAAHGFPVPKPKEPPTTAELIAGSWLLVKNFNLIEDVPPLCEFTSEGGLIIAQAGQEVIYKVYRLGKLNGHEAILISETDGEWQLIRFISAQKMVLCARNKESIYERQ